MSNILSRILFSGGAENAMRNRAREAQEALLALGDNSGLHGDALTRIKKVTPSVAQLFDEVIEWLQRDDVEDELVYACWSETLATACDALASLRHELDTNLAYIDLRKEIGEHVAALEDVARELLKDRAPPPERGPRIRIFN